MLGHLPVEAAIHRREVRSEGAGEQRGGGCAGGDPAELAADEVGDLLGDLAIRGDLPADDRQQSGRALALVVEQRVLARNLALLYAFLAYEGAHPGHRVMDPVEWGAGECPSRLVHEVPDV